MVGHSFSNLVGYAVQLVSLSDGALIESNLGIAIPFWELDGR